MWRKEMGKESTVPAIKASGSDGNRMAYWTLRKMNLRKMNLRKITILDPGVLAILIALSDTLVAIRGFPRREHVLCNLYLVLFLGLTLTQTFLWDWQWITGVLGA